MTKLRNKFRLVQLFKRQGMPFWNFCTEDCAKRSETQ